MTYTGDFATGEDTLETPSYPTAFGITFTPVVMGGLAAVAGVGLAAYLATQFVAPAHEQYQTLRESVAQKELDIEQKAETAKRVNDVVASLNRAKASNADVRTLFSTQKALDTLLLDLNRMIVASNAELLTFKPDYGASGVLTDSSLGPELNNKLKRQVTSVSFQGTFSQTLQIMQAIDRLQTVLVVKNLSMEVKSAKKDGPSQNLVTSRFKLYAYVPLASEAAAPAPAASTQAPK